MQEGHGDSRLAVVRCLGGTGAQVSAGVAEVAAGGGRPGLGSVHRRRRHRQEPQLGDRGPVERLGEPVVRIAGVPRACCSRSCRRCTTR